MTAREDGTPAGREVLRELYSPFLRTGRRIEDLDERLVPGQPVRYRAGPLKCAVCVRASAHRKTEESAMRYAMLFLLAAASATAAAQSPRVAASAHSQSSAMRRAGPGQYFVASPVARSLLGG